MSECLDSQNQQISNFRKLLQERNAKANPRRKLSAEETKRLNKLEALADKLKPGENVQNRQLNEYAKGGDIVLIGTVIFIIYIIVMGAITTFVSIRPNLSKN